MNVQSYLNQIAAESDDIEQMMIINDVIYRCKTFEEMKTFVDACLAAKFNFQLHVGLIGAIRACAVSVGPMTLASFGLVPTIGSTAQGKELMDKVKESARKVGIEEGIKADNVNKVVDHC